MASSKVKAYAVGVVDPDTGEEARISITTVMYNPNDGLLYCGLTDMKNDLLYSFDLNSKEFKSLGFKRIADKYDVKIHRSLILEDDGTILGATAGLHGIEERMNALGGKLFRYDPRSGDIELIARPVERDYIQTIALDKERGIIYGLTYPVGKFFRYDLDGGKKAEFYIGTYPHYHAIDDDGGMWSGWGRNNYFFRYDPDAEEMHWHKIMLQRIGPGDDGQIDGMINGGDGYIYIGATSGALFRLEPKALEIKYLGKPCPGMRMPCLGIGEDGLIYGVAGYNKNTTVFAYDRDAEKFYNFGPVYDPERDTICYIAHHMAMSDRRTLYTCETDNPHRPGYVWECKLDL